MNEQRYQMDLLQAMNDRLKWKERMYRLVCANTTCAFLYYSFEREELVSLGRFREFFDFDAKSVYDVNRLYDLVEPDSVDSLRDALFPEKRGEDNAFFECKCREKKVWYRFVTKLVRDEDLGNVTDKVVVIHDVTRYRLQNEELEYLAYFDELTGLYSRNYFVRMLGEAVRNAKDNQELVSVLVLDIDDFHKINDGLGIEMGDELMQQIGSFLKDLAIEEHFFAGHFGADVYCIAIPNPVGSRSVESIHRRIRRRIKEPFLLSGGQAVNITLSIGVAEYPEAADNPLDLIKCAEIVMLKGKDQGKDTIQYFDTPILHEFMETVALENKLREAVFHKNFTMYFQPQFHSGDRKLRGMEALIRWRDEEKGMISPGVFIPLAEKNGLILPIGDWVLEESISRYAEWKAKYHQPFVLSINISAVQYNKEDFVERLRQLLEQYHVEPYEIELEITETVLLGDFEVVSEKLKKLREWGVKVSLDDFGTGYSSLSYLKKLPVDTLKIDKSFIDTVLTDPATRIIMESIINMVRALGHETVAEGVEQEEQYRYLYSVGCDVIQGYLFGKPMPGEEIEELLSGL